MAEGRLTRGPRDDGGLRPVLPARRTEPQLQEGDRIIAGSVVAPVAVAPGDELSVSFGPLGHLSVRFED